MRRYNVRLSLALLFLFALATSCTRHESRFRIGVSQCSDDEWRHQMNNEMLREALFYDGVEVHIRTAKDDNARQMEDIRNFIREGVDLLVVAAPETVVPDVPSFERWLEERKVREQPSRDVDDTKYSGQGTEQQTENPLVREYAV